MRRIYIVTYGPREQATPEQPLGDYHDHRAYTRIAHARFALQQCMEEQGALASRFHRDHEAEQTGGPHVLEAWSSTATTVWLEELLLDESEPEA